jgi:histidyl-tRNA synthetase
MAARIAPLSGFPEWLPGQRIVEQHVLDVLREVFELHGFASIETRSVEPLEQMLRKGEIDKEVYVLRRLQAGDDESGGDANRARQLGLHFDLTVPLARYVLENAGHLDFPFRRYQLQKAWRGERPQEGRFREFTQADIDVIGRDALPFHHEVEVARVMAEALSRLPLPPVVMQVNSRKLIEGYYRGVGVGGAGGDEQIAGVMRVVDKLDKVGEAGVRQLLADEVGLSEEQAKACVALTAISSTAEDLAEQVRGLGVGHPLLDEGLAELLRVLEGTASLHSDRLAVVADLSVARGLDYYPGVGISFGVTRTIAPLLSRGLLMPSRSTPTCVLVALPAEESRTAAGAVASALRGRGVATEVSPTPAKYGKQIRDASRRGIPFVWFPQEDGSHQVRDIRTGEQQDADLAAWVPPAEDLRPSVTGTVATDA